MTRLTGRERREVEEELAQLREQRQRIENELAEYRARAVVSVEEAAAAHGEASEQLDQAVARARDYGASWADIGRAVGITRQSAHERWGEPKK